MSQDKSLTFEEVNKHVEQYFKEEHHGRTAAVAPSLCSIYKVVRPILKLIADFPLLPKKWRDAVNTLISVIDVMCPQS